MLASVNSSYTDVMTSVFSSTIAAKAWFATAAAAFAVVQVTTGARIFGKLQHLVPVVGGSLFAAIATLWGTGSLWYFTEVRFGF